MLGATSIIQFQETLAVRLGQHTCVLLNTQMFNNQSDKSISQTCKFASDSDSAFVYIKLL